MLTLKLISEETERVIKGLEKKHFSGAREAVEKVLEYDRLRRETQQKLDTNKQHQNQLSKQIGQLMKDGKKDEANNIKEAVADKYDELKNETIPEKIEDFKEKVEDTADNIEEKAENIKENIKFRNEGI